MSTPNESSSSGDPSSYSSQSQTQSSTLDTVSTQDVVDGNLSDPDEPVVNPTWGRLFPLGPGFKVIELVENEYSFGRGTSNICQFEAKDFKSNPHYQALSTTHYKLFREKDSSGFYNSFITDLSSNGTFINSEKIGKNKTHVLNNNDEISLSVLKNKAYIFQEYGKVTEDQKNLPDDFKAKYTLSKKIGRGACGEVYLCFTKGTCQRFAVKMINKKEFSVANKSTKDEVEILKALDHPTIISICDVFESDDKVCIVLELVEGGELFDRVKKERQLQEPTAKLLFYQMLTGVKYLHDKGITHRDLKETPSGMHKQSDDKRYDDFSDTVFKGTLSRDEAENVLLVSEKTDTLIKIADFGLSKIVGEQSLMKTLCGTPDYLAPEVLMSVGRGSYSQAVDCWSLGVLLFVCLGGYPPFSEEFKPLTREQRIKKGVYKFLSPYWDKVSSDAKDLVAKLLTVDPSKRLTVYQALQHPWLQDKEMIAKANKIMYGSKEDMGPPCEAPSAKKRKIAE